MWNPPATPQNILTQQANLIRLYLSSLVVSWPLLWLYWPLYRISGQEGRGHYDWRHDDLMSQQNFLRDSSCIQIVCLKRGVWLRFKEAIMLERTLKAWKKITEYDMHMRLVLKTCDTILWCACDASDVFMYFVCERGTRKDKFYFYTCMNKSSITAGHCDFFVLKGGAFEKSTLWLSNIAEREDIMTLNLFYVLCVTVKDYIECNKESIPI